MRNRAYVELHGDQWVVYVVGDAPNGEAILFHRHWHRSKVQDAKSDLDAYADRLDAGIDTDKCAPEFVEELTGLTGEDLKKLRE